MSVTCTIAGGDLPLVVSWTLNGYPLEPYLEIITETRGKRINNLIVESVSAKHAGNYTCIAENAAGFAQHSAELVVIGRPHYTGFISSCVPSLFFTIRFDLGEEDIYFWLFFITYLLKKSHS